jgi:hypothetical protein
VETEELTTLRAHLINRGWAELSADQPFDLVNVGRTLGTPVPSRLGQSLLDTLVPTVPEQARRRSMSAFFGLGSFPFHTDSANRILPPRYVILRMKRGFESEIATLISDFRGLGLSEKAIQLMKREVWLAHGGPRPFLASILSSPSKTFHSFFIRFDPCCMKVAHNTFGISGEILKNACNTNHFRYVWRRNRILILDNWRMLHAREAAHFDGGRTLERMLIHAHPTTGE